MPEAASAVVVVEQVLAGRVMVHRVVSPVCTVMVPVAVPEPGLETDTVEVKITVCSLPKATEEGASATAVVVAALLTVWPPLSEPEEDE